MCDQIGWSEDQAVSVGRAISRVCERGRERCRALPAHEDRKRVRGAVEPAVAYPASSADLTAGAWNAVAAANQRVVVAILPEPAASATGERR
jgi:hypothetical protein